MRGGNVITFVRVGNLSHLPGDGKALGWSGELFHTHYYRIAGNFRGPSMSVVTISVSMHPC